LPEFVVEAGDKKTAPAMKTAEVPIKWYDNNTGKKGIQGHSC